MGWSAKQIGTHKIVIHVLWHIVQLLKLMTEKNPKLKKNLHEKT